MNRYNPSPRTECAGFLLAAIFVMLAVAFGMSL